MAYRQTDRQTDTDKPNYMNPRCTCAPRVNEKIGGKKNYTTGGSMRAHKSSKKKPSNAFITFSTSFQPTFVHAIKTAEL